LESSGRRMTARKEKRKSRVGIVPSIIFEVAERGRTREDKNAALGYPCLMIGGEEKKERSSGMWIA